MHGAEVSVEILEGAWMLAVLLGNTASKGSSRGRSEQLQPRRPWSVGLHKPSVHIWCQGATGATVGYYGFFPAECP